MLWFINDSFKKYDVIISGDIVFTLKGGYKSRGKQQCRWLSWFLYTQEIWPYSLWCIIVDDDSNIE